jgi:hypothetical protein
MHNIITDMLFYADQSIASAIDSVASRWRSSAKQIMLMKAEASLFHWLYPFLNSDRNYQQYAQVRVFFLLRFMVWTKEEKKNLFVEFSEASAWFSPCLCLCKTNATNLPLQHSKYCFLHYRMLK